MGKTVKKFTPASIRFQRIFKILENIAELVGGNIMRNPYKFTFMTYTVIIFIISYFACTIYTSYVAIAIQKDWLLMLQSVSLTGTAVQGVAKLISAVTHAPRIRFLRYEIDGIYEKYERQEFVGYQNYLSQSLVLIKRMTFTLLTLYIVVVILLICVPLYFRYVFHQRILILQFLLPTIDHTSHWGYVIHQVIHVICICFGLFGNFVSDTLCFVLVAHIPLFKNILKCKLNDLDEVLKQYPRNASKSGPLLKDIFQFHQKYIHFSTLAKDSFFWVIFVQIGTTTACIICTVICLFLGTMPSGFVYLVYSFVILYIYSGLGNLVEISNDEVTTDIYDSAWYLLTAPEQKMILIMLRESQVTEGMSIGGISPLSLNAALQITKSIYTVAMMIHNFLH